MSLEHIFYSEFLKVRILGSRILDIFLKNVDIFGQNPKSEGLDKQFNVLSFENDCNLRNSILKLSLQRKIGCKSEMFNEL